MIPGICPSPSSQTVDRPGTPSSLSAKARPGHCVSADRRNEKRVWGELPSDSAVSDRSGYASFSFQASRIGTNDYEQPGFGFHPHLKSLLFLSRSSTA
jgi:hypothetical protein